VFLSSDLAGGVDIKTYTTTDPKAPIRLSATHRHATGANSYFEISIVGLVANVTLKQVEKASSDAWFSSAPRTTPGFTSALVGAGSLFAHWGRKYWQNQWEWQEVPAAAAVLVGTLLLPTVGAFCAPSADIVIQVPSSTEHLFRFTTLDGALIAPGSALTGESYTIPLGLSTLPSSGKLDLLTLKRGGKYVARSHDGRDWEGVLPSPISPACVEGRCGIEVSKEDAGLYTVERVEVPAISDEAQISRFLMQSTFGATRASIDELTSQYGGNVEQWMKAQVALPATLLRTYLRERTNPRARQGSDLRAACDAGSRWLAFTFDRMDVGKKLMVSAAQESGRFSLVIDGVQRGEVTLDGVAWSTEAASTSHMICSVTEAVGGEVLISSTAACENTTARANPALALSGTTAVVILAAPISFIAVQDVPGAYVLQKPPPGCSLRDGRDSYISVGGILYRHDPRVRLLENTVEAPAATIAASGTCPAVGRTFVNAGGCVRRPGLNTHTHTHAHTHIHTHTQKHIQAHKYKHTHTHTHTHTYQVARPSRSPPHRSSSMRAPYGAGTPGASASCIM
jgi:hypothetical protein